MSELHHPDYWRQKFEIAEDRAEVAKLDSKEWKRRALDAEASAEAAERELDKAVEWLRKWRESLWDEVHRVGGPRKGSLVDLGRMLDGALSSGVSAPVPPEAQSEEADLVSPSRSDQAILDGEGEK